MFEYLASVQSAVRRFNDRMKQLAKNLGENNSFIEDAKAKLHTLFSGNYRYKDGVPQIVKPKQIYDDPEKNMHLVNLLEDTPTWGEVRKTFEPYYQEYKEQEQFFGQEPVKFDKFISTMISLPDAITRASTQQDERALSILQIKGRKKTYAELEDVVRIMSGG